MQKGTVCGAVRSVYTTILLRLYSAFLTALTVLYVLWTWLLVKDEYTATVISQVY